LPIFYALSLPRALTTSLPALNEDPLTPGKIKPNADSAASVKLPVANPVIIPAISIASPTPGIADRAAVAIALPA
jgi:hypothetical protein